MIDYIELKADLLICIQTQNLKDFKSLLHSSQSHLNQILDHHNSSIFHDIALASLPEAIQSEFLLIILSYSFKIFEEKAYTHIQSVLNTTNSNDLLTPLMIAVQTNKISLLKEFIKLGANFKLTNNIGQNLAHIAAQYGYFQILVYLKYELDMDLELLDNEHKSPLCLAVLNGRESIVTALISWGSNINISDNKGDTLLHMASKNDHYKVCKILLLRGISRTIKNSEGLTAHDTIKNSNSQISSITKQPTILSQFNPLKPPLTPIKNSYKLFTIYFLMFILRYVLVITFLLPHFAIELSLVSVALFFTNFILFLIVHQKDPGFIKQSKGQNIIKLYKNVHYDNICTFCETIKKISTFHCHHCDKCVDEYDHHCPWIRNCVGKNNYSVFVAFLTVACVDFLYTSVLGLLDYFQLLQKDRRFFDYKVYHKEFGLFVTGLCIGCFLFAFPICFLHVRGICKGKKRKIYGQSVGNEMDFTAEERLIPK